MCTRVLVVEEDQCSRDGLRDLLLRAGHAVQVYRDARQAAELVRAEEFDIALVDLDSPLVGARAMSGWDLVRILRESKPALPIVGVTAEGQNPDAAERAAALRVTEVLAKPINPRYLKAVVATLGDRRSDRTETGLEMPGELCQACVS